MNVFTLNLKASLIVFLGLLVPLASIGFLVGASMGELAMLSEKDLVHAWKEIEPQTGQPVYYLNYLPVSATYYSEGAARLTDGASTGLPDRAFWLAVHKQEGDASQWNCDLRFEPKRGLFDLYYCME